MCGWKMGEAFSENIDAYILLLHWYGYYLEVSQIKSTCGQLLLVSIWWENQQPALCYPSVENYNILVTHAQMVPTIGGQNFGWNQLVLN